MSEFIINKFLKLKLENGKTNIFVNDVRVIQCKYLLLNNPNVNNNVVHMNNENITIDTQSTELDHSLELEEENRIEILPETEFWAHSSNLQAWYENNYDTEVIHSNLAFPLLRKLTNAGDEMAKEMFKKEIIKRFRGGGLNVMTFLIKEGYLDQLDIEMSESLYQELDFETYKKLQKRLRKVSKKKEGFSLTSRFRI